MNEQVEITVEHLHFMAHCRRLAALIREACLGLEAWDQPGTSVMFFFVSSLRDPKAVILKCSPQKYGYLKDQLSAQFTFHHL